MFSHGALLSELLKQPGPTHGFFDIMAATVHVVAPESRVGLLGFAYGGMMAPLRALSPRGSVVGVDLCRTGYSVFRRTARAWAKDVTFVEGDAVRWLRARQAPFDLLVEDLSEVEGGDVVKPSLTWTTLPKLMRRRIRPAGAVLTNVLKPPHLSWAQAVEPLAAIYPCAHVILCHQYENRLVLAGRYPWRARSLSRAIAAALRQLKSRQARQIAVRTVS